MKARYVILPALFLAVIAVSLSTRAAPVTGNSVVLELFTSQGCSSCPPADDLLTGLASDPSVLPLSFHIDYWDNLGWKDVFSSPDSTKRQWTYARSLGLPSVFTPQLIVDGNASVVGSHAWDVRHAIAAARKKAHPVHLELKSAASGFFLNVHSENSEGLEFWEVRFVTKARTDVKHGENGGRTMASINNVTKVKRLDAQKNAQNHKISSLEGADDGIAIIAQESGQGKILGSAVYVRP